MKVQVLAYMSRFKTSSEVVADKHQLVITRHIMQPSIAYDSKILDPLCSTTDIPPTDIPPPQSVILGLHPIARELISHPAEGRRLSWPGHTVGQQLAQGCL